MIKLRNAVLAMAMGLLATGALAQHFTQDSQAALVAEELFGGGAVKLEFKDFGDEDDDFVPKAKLIWDGTDLTDNTQFSVTFTLSNATFAEPVSNTDFRWGSWGPDPDGADDQSGTEDDNMSLIFAEEDTADPPNIKARELVIERDGGNKGDTSVTFHVTHSGQTDLTPISQNADGEYAGETRKIVFALPDVNASGLVAPDAEGKGAKSVNVWATISQPKSGGTNILESVMNGHLCGMTEVVKAPGTAGCPVVNAAAVITSIKAAAGGGRISLAPTDERTVLVGADGKASDPQRAHLATVTVETNLASGARDQDGDVIDGFTGDLAGSLAIKVASDGFGEDDVVYIDSNANEKVDGREAFEMDDGVASDTVPLGAGSLAIYYAPSGDDALKHRTEFSTTAITEFSDSDNKVRGTAVAAVAQLKLQGIKDGVAKAYAIAPVTSTDMANVRVTCETSAKTGCDVFLDCKDQMGMNTFGEAGMNVGPGMTERWSQMDIAMALGLDDGWDGRMGCDVLSSAPITVQVLTRAAGVLVNNTAISTGGN